MSKKYSIRFTQKEIEFLMKITEEDNPVAASEKFIELLVEERVDPDKINVYVKKLMERVK